MSTFDVGYDYRPADVEAYERSSNAPAKTCKCGEPMHPKSECGECLQCDLIGCLEHLAKHPNDRDTAEYAEMLSAEIERETPNPIRRVA